MVQPLNRWKPRLEPKGKVAKIQAFLHGITKTQGEQAGAQALRTICRQDLFYLCYEILNYRDLDDPLHDDMCDFMAMCDRERLTSLTLIPRGHFKSSIATVGRSIQWIIQDQNTAIGLVSSDLKNSKKFLREIRVQIEQNEKLKALFPEIFYKDPRRESPKWTEEEIQVRRTKIRKEGTIKIFGLDEGIPTGDHYPRILVDDAVNADNVKTEERLAKIEENARLLLPLLEVPDQPIHWVGTRYHIRDYYAKLMEHGDIALYYRQAVEDGKPIFGNRFTPEILEKTRIKVGTYIFNCQYMMEPMDPGSMRFKREWLRYAPHPVTTINPGMVFFLTVDPASQTRKESDFTAMLVFGIDHLWNFYMVDGVHDKLNPGQLVDRVFELVERWGIEVVGLETIAFQKTYKFWLERKMEEKDKRFVIVELKGHKTTKDDRIKGLQPIMEAGKFWLPPKGQKISYTRLWENPDDGQAQTVDIVEQFLVEFDLYPDATHDDLLDVAAMAREIAQSGTVVTKKWTDMNADYSLAKQRSSEDTNEEAEAWA